MRLAAWYHDHGDVRDHKEMFIVTLVLSDFEGHRDVGLALLRGLPPYQVVRVLDFIHGRKATRKVRPAAAGSGKAAREPRRPKTPRPRARPRRSSRSSACSATRRGAADRDRALPARARGRRRMVRQQRAGRAQGIKRLYALLHVAPGERAQQILFDENPPADSRLFALKELAKAESPAEQAARDHRACDPVPGGGHGRQADDADGPAGPDRADEPAGADQQPGRLKRRGAFDNADLKSADRGEAGGGEDGRARQCVQGRGGRQGR